MAYSTQIEIANTAGTHIATIISYGRTSQESRENAAGKTKRCGYLDHSINRRYHITTTELS